MLLDWASEGMLARVALILYAIGVLLVVLPSVRRNAVLRQLLLPAILWHFVVWTFTAFWMLPYYAGETGADCYGYHTDGIAIAELIRAGDWANIPWGWSTSAIQILTGFIYAPIGGDVYGMLFLSAVLGLCGSFYFCLAFSEWAGPAQIRRYALIVLFLPSLAMWTGMFGKDSWMAFGLGFAAYGYALILRRLSLSAICHLAAGVILVTVVRPHIAIILVASMALAYFSFLALGRGNVSILVKVPLGLMFIAMFALVGSVAQGFLGMEEVSLNSLQDYGETKGEGNAVGGSAVEVQTAPGTLGMISQFPRGAVRVLFQPFSWEIRNVTSGLAAAENLLIFWIILSHVSQLRKLLREILREPYVLFSAALAVGLIMMFSLTPNLGLLSRERSQLLPFLFALLMAAGSAWERKEFTVIFETELLDEPQVPPLVEVALPYLSNR